MKRSYLMGTKGPFSNPRGTRVWRRVLIHTTVYPKVSGLATWSENCKWYSS